MAADKVDDILEAFIAQHHTAIEQRGALIAANKALKATRTFLRWCVGRAVLDQSPADGVPLPAKEARRRAGPGHHRWPEDGTPIRRDRGTPRIDRTTSRGAARATWDELDLHDRIWLLPNARTKNAKPRIVHLSDQSIALHADWFPNDS